MQVGEMEYRKLNFLRANIDCLKQLLNIVQMSIVSQLCNQFHDVFVIKNYSELIKISYNSKKTTYHCVQKILI